MPSERIAPGLVAEIIRKSNLGQAQVYNYISKTTKRDFLSRNLAAIKVAADFGVNISKYAAPAELQQLRQAGTPVAPPPAASSTPSSGKLSTRRPPTGTASRRETKTVFVVHGRDMVVKTAVFSFLRALGIKPLEWNAALESTGKASAFIGEILDSAFKKAAAVLVLITPDDWAQLREEFVSAQDPPFEKTKTGQARPNVIFEAGMAFAHHPDRTILVQVGSARPFSDVAGRHVTHMSNAPEKRRELATKLRNAGCDVDESGVDWLSVGDFSDPLSRAAAEPKRKNKAKQKGKK